MQEIRKVLNPETIIDEKPKRALVRLCLVEAANRVIPVYVPSEAYVHTGDIVFFDYNNESYSAVVLMEKDIWINEEEWHETINAINMAPVKAKKTASVRECEWEE